LEAVEIALIGSVGWQKTGRFPYCRKAQSVRGEAGEMQIQPMLRRSAIFELINWVAEYGEFAAAIMVGIPAASLLILA
jgi:hypothetical protein